MEELTDNRGRVITSYLHTASRAIINLLVREGSGTLGSGTLGSGKNVGWKQEVNLGQQNNQAFVFLPHARVIQMLTSKAALVGIQVSLSEEGHPSQCSFLDLESLGHHVHYLGTRVKRGLFVASTGQAMQADVHGSYHILRRYAPHVVAAGVSALRLRPLSLHLPDRWQDTNKQLPRRTTA